MKNVVITLAMIAASFVLKAQDGIAVGSKAAGFTAKDQNGKTINLATALKTGKVIIVFYRGNWCPNCTRELSNIQDSLSLFQEQNITVIGIGPETATGIKKTAEKTKASFPVISDSGLTIMKNYKVAFTITDDMDEVHKKYNIDVSANNGTNGNILPRPSAFIINQEGIIIYRYLNNSPYSDANSNNRITVKELLEKAK